MRKGTKNKNRVAQKQSKVTVDLYSSLSPETLSLGTQVRYVLTRDHTVLPATHTVHTFIHRWNEPCLPLPRSQVDSTKDQIRATFVSPFVSWLMPAEIKNEVQNR